MSDTYTRLGRELLALEKVDPAVRAARERLEEVISPYQRWRREMVRDLWGKP